MYNVFIIDKNIESRYIKIIIVIVVIGNWFF